MISDYDLRSQRLLFNNCQKLSFINLAESINTKPKTINKYKNINFEQIVLLNLIWHHNDENHMFYSYIQDL